VEVLAAPATLHRHMDVVVSVRIVRARSTRATGKVGTLDPVRFRSGSERCEEITHRLDPRQHVVRAECEEPLGATPGAGLDLVP